MRAKYSDEPFTRTVLYIYIYILCELDKLIKRKVSQKVSEEEKLIKEKKIDEDQYMSYTYRSLAISYCARRRARVHILLACVGTYAREE